MRSPYRVGITGGIGAGKTIVSHLFSLLGIPVYNADNAARQIMASDPEVARKIKTLLGEEAYTAAVLNTGFVAKSIYNDQNLLTQLNGIVHPAVADHFEHWLVSHYGVPYILKEAALIFEAGSGKSLQRIIVVAAPVEVRLARIARRDPHRTRQQSLAIMSKQLPEEEKIALADDVVYNDEQQLVIPQVIHLHGKFLKLAAENDQS